MGIDYYGDLGLDKNSSEKDIKKAYYKLAKKYHPDNNLNDKSSEEKFKKISAAYAILSDPEKRKKYDKFGPAAFENGNDGVHIDPFDIFNNVMGGGSPFNGFMGGFNPFGGRGKQRDRSQMKSPGKEVPIKMNLNDLYSGKSININYNRKNKCNLCEGLGVKNKDCIIKCDLCNGNGSISITKQMGPFTQIINKPCDKCGGKATMIKPGSECSKCNGSKIEKEIINLEIYIPPGASHGYKIPFEGKSDWNPEFGYPGDLIFVIMETSHEFFKREGNNLIIHRYISLKEALTDFSFRIFHLDGRVLELAHNNIIRPDQIMTVEGEGMPKGPGEIENGDLIIKFDIIFPSHLDEKRKMYLNKILPDLEPTELDVKLSSIKDNIIEKHKMVNYNLKNSNNSNASNNSNMNHKPDEGDTSIGECVQQ